MIDGQEETRPAGGFATQRGINYQNRVAAFFAASCLAESIAVPGLPHSPVQSIRCETGEPLADILLTFESNGIAFIEVKRTIQLTASRMKPVCPASTILSPQRLLEFPTDITNSFSPFRA